MSKIVKNSWWEETKLLIFQVTCWQHWKNYSIISCQVLSGWRYHQVKVKRTRSLGHLFQKQEIIRSAKHRKIKKTLTSHRKWAPQDTISLQCQQLKNRTTFYHPKLKITSKTFKTFCLNGFGSCWSFNLWYVGSFCE